MVGNVNKFTNLPGSVFGSLKIHPTISSFSNIKFFISSSFVVKPLSHSIVNNSPCKTVSFPLSRKTVTDKLLRR